MLQVFSISFLLVGLPIIFSLEVLLGLGKLFVYSSMASILLVGINYKRLIKFGFFNKNIFILLLIYLEFFIVALLSNVDIKQMKELLIIFLILLSVFTIRIKKDIEDSLFKSVFFISGFSVLFVYLSTPMDFKYWALYGGRAYIGDTGNPNLLSWVAAINIICIFIFLFKYKISFLIKTTLSIIFIFDVYLYFLSFSKSSVLGIILIILFYTFKYKHKIIFSREFYVFLILVISLIIVFHNDIYNYFELIINTVNSLIFGGNSVMSAYIRKENFIKSFELLQISNFFGYGINTFRMDSPVLQVYIDFGNILGTIFLIMFVIIPIFKIVISRYRFTGFNQEFSILLYLFFLPNLFFHGTPYEWYTWLPVLIFYMFNKRKKHAVSSNNNFYISQSS